MRKHCSDVCKLRPCLNKESKNSARLRTIVTAVLQRQYSQTELIFWISLAYNCTKMLLAAKTSLRLPQQTWESHGAMLQGYCQTMMQRIEV